jgi:hypothetical protein
MSFHECLEIGVKHGGLAISSASVFACFIVIALNPARGARFSRGSNLNRGRTPNAYVPLVADTASISTVKRQK